VNWDFSIYYLDTVFQIISAYQIPKPNNSKKGEVIDPFVKIEIHGVKTDQQSVKTSVIDNNGEFRVNKTT
jgi:phosphatidylinositol phospholipase C delta